MAFTPKISECNVCNSGTSLDKCWSWEMVKVCSQAQHETPKHFSTSGEEPLYYNKDKQLRIRILKAMNYK